MPPRLSRSPYLLISLLVAVAVLYYEFHDSAHLQPTWEYTSDIIDRVRWREVVYGDGEQIHVEKEKDGLPAFCDYCGKGDEICQRYGPFNLARSRAYEGPNTRLKRILRTALQNPSRPLKIGIIGGSVTKGHGTSYTENWTTLFGQYISSHFNISTEVHNGGVGATISQYMETCFLEHIPSDVDIVVVELAINDQRLEWLARGYENLLRGLLELERRPAVINLQIMALSFETITMGGDLHTAVAQYYDTPILSVRNILLPHILQTTQTNTTDPDISVEDYWFHHNHGDNSLDLRHLNKEGHRLMADIMNSFTARVGCEVLREDREKERRARTGELGEEDNAPMWGWKPVEGDFLPEEGVSGEYMPRLGLWDKYDHTTRILPSHPTCMSISTSAHPLVPLPSLSKGWEKWSHPSNKAKVFLRATEVGAHAAFGVGTSREKGRVRVTYQRSRTYGLGSAMCWVDEDKKKGVRLDGYWEVNNIHAFVTTSITEDVPPGEHILHCEVMKESKDPGGGNEFRIVAVDAL